MNRRNFLKASGAAAMMPAAFSAHAQAAKPKASSAASTAANNRINIGVIGLGWQGPSNTRSFLPLEGCQVVAACDIDKNNLAAGVKMVNDAYDTQDCRGYHDYKELLARPDIDAVMIAVPDHWHALVATEAARQKKDVYGEKPLAKTIVDQQAIVHAVQQNNVIWQMGSWQRSQPTFQKAAEIVRNGLIGTVTHVEVGLPGGNDNYDKKRDEANAKLVAAGLKPTPFEEIVPGSKEWDALATAPPPELDYDTWVGPAQMGPYFAGQIHKNWRWNYNTGGGHLMDWIGHHCDIALWGLDFDRTGPMEIEATEEHLPPNAIWDTARKYRSELKYPHGVTMTISGGYPDIQTGTKWIGTEGWVYVDRGKFDASNPDLKVGKYLPRELRKVKLYTSSNHWQNFLDSIRTRQPTSTPVETGHNSAIPGHLSFIAAQTGRKIRWDAKTETIVGDPAATKLMSREYRSGWKLS